MTLTVYENLEQGSDDWLQARCGMICASDLNKILTPTLKQANNDHTKKHAYHLAAERITNYVEPAYIGDNALKGMEGELLAREIYEQHYAPVQEIGGMVRDFGGFKLWSSPDGLVWGDGGIEIKTRAAKFQIETISTMEIPIEHRLQVQAGIMVSGRDWWDYVSFCGGMPLCVIRVLPDPVMQSAIISACEAFEEKIAEVIEKYKKGLLSMEKVIETERQNRDLEVFM